MLLYIVKRILIMIPTIFAIMLISFLISRNVPGDIVLSEMDVQDKQNVKIDRERSRREYKKKSEEMGMDQPMFYFSLTSIAYPDTLHRIVNLMERAALNEMVGRYGNWEQISAYYHAVCALEDEAFTIKAPRGDKNEFDAMKLALTELRETPGRDEILFRVELIDSVCSKFPEQLGSIQTGMQEVKALFGKVENEATTWKLYVPSVHLHGFGNQFHHWVKRVFTLDFGRSYRDKRPVKDKILDALPWTIFMGFISFVLAYLIAIPIGVYSVRHRNSWQDRTLTTLLFLLWSIPSFVMAMILMTLLCNPDYLYIFPTSGVSSDGADNWPFFSRLLDYAYHLILPTICYTYGSMVFLSRQMRVGMLESINSDYIRTARAKGLSERAVIWKHAFRNSILPLVTHFASLLPRLVAGAVIIESIFSIPGLGRLTVKAIFAYDHPVVIAVFTMGAVLTLLGILVADILYAIVDPRISYSE